jgi:hypothetical protein
MEVEFNESVEVERLTQLLRYEFPAGLVLLSVELVPSDLSKAQVASVAYEIDVPPIHLDAAQAAIREFLSMPECWIERQGRIQPVDLRANLVSLEIDQGKLRIEQTTSREAAASPREILKQLGLASIEEDGARLTRTRVDLVAQAQL